MLQHVAIAVIACAALATVSPSRAATSIPMPEAGFALASNGGNGADTITAPMPSDAGGGVRSSARLDPGPETKTDTAREPAAADSAPTHSDSGHAAKSDGTPATASHKARGNAHWQSLLPGLMK